MPDHSPQHLARLSRESAARRRSDKISRLVTTAPPLKAEQIEQLVALLRAHAVLPSRRVSA